MVSVSFLLLATAFSSLSVPQAGTVLAEQKISSTAGALPSALDDLDGFGDAVARLNDLNGDGRDELAVGAPFDDDGGVNKGAVHVLFLNVDGTVASAVKLSETAGGLAGPLTSGGELGAALDHLDDLDGDGVDDLLVGSPLEDGTGSVRCLFLNPDGTVSSQVEIGQGLAGFGGTLDAGDRFGSDVSLLGDVDGDGIDDVAVGAFGDDDGGTRRGAVWILFLNADGTVKGERKISHTAGGFGGGLDDLDDLGRALGGLGDIDGDGIPDLAVGAPGDDDGFASAGAVYVLFLNADGTVKLRHKISATSGGFGPGLGAFDRLGWSLRRVADLDGDQRDDLCVGAFDDDDGGITRGALYVLFLNNQGTVKARQKISATAGGLVGPLSDGDAFGWSCTSVGDVDGDGFSDLAVGAVGDDDGGPDRGAVWVLFPDGIDGLPPVLSCPPVVQAECTAPEGAFVTYSVTADDAVDPAPVVSCAPPSGSLFPPGATLVTCTATDTAGNGSSCSFEVVVADTTAPAVSCAGDLVVECTSPAGTAVSFAASATDGCDPAPVISCSPPSGSAFPLGTTTVTCTATDASGNAGSCSFSVTVEDTQAPVLDHPARVTAECASPAGTMVELVVTASDLCDPAPSVSLTPPSGSLFPPGVTRVTATATDASGNQATSTFDVFVVDTTPPALTCPADLQVSGGPGVVVEFSPTATDLCDPVPTIVCVPPSGSPFPLGVTPVTCTATDAAGNSVACTFEVEVVAPPAVPALGTGALFLLAVVVVGAASRNLVHRHHPS